MTLEEYLDQVIKAGNIAIKFTEEIKDFSVEVMIPLFCTILDSYCEQNNLSSTEVSKEIACEVEAMNKEEGPMFKS